MATFTKRDSGNWQSKIRPKGQKPISKTFRTKALAKAWATKVENELNEGTYISTSAAEINMVSDLLHDYWNEKVQTQKSAEGTRYVLNKFIIQFDGYRMIDVTPEVIRRHKNDRLKEVSGDTVRKELLLLKRFFAYAQKEWQINIPRGNPVTPIELPKKGKARERRLMQGEYEKLIKEAIKYGGFIKDIIDLAIETGMRRGEIVKLEWKHFNPDKRTFYIPETKNEEARTVPLTKKAAETFNSIARSGESVFNILGGSVGQAESTRFS